MNKLFILISIMTYLVINTQLINHLSAQNPCNCGPINSITAAEVSYLTTNLAISLIAPNQSGATPYMHVEGSPTRKVIIENTIKNYKYRIRFNANASCYPNHYPANISIANWDVSTALSTNNFNVFYPYCSGSNQFYNYHGDYIDIQPKAKGTYPIDVYYYTGGSQLYVEHIILEVLDSESDLCNPVVFNVTRENLLSGKFSVRILNPIPNNIYEWKYNALDPAPFYTGSNLVITPCDYENITDCNKIVQNGSLLCDDFLHGGNYNAWQQNNCQIDDQTRYFADWHPAFTFQVKVNSFTCPSNNSKLVPISVLDCSQLKIIDITPANKNKVYSTCRTLQASSPCEDIKSYKITYEWEDNKSGVYTKFKTTKPKESFDIYKGCSDFNVRVRAIEPNGSASKYVYYTVNRMQFITPISTYDGNIITITNYEANPYVCMPNIVWYNEFGIAVANNSLSFNASKYSPCGYKTMSFYAAINACGTSYKTSAFQHSFSDKKDLKNYIRTVTLYRYDDTNENHLYPVEVEQYMNNCTTIVSNFSYPPDYSNVLVYDNALCKSCIQDLKDNFIVNKPIEKIVYEKGQFGTRILSGEINTYYPSTNVPNANNIPGLIKNTYNLELAVPRPTQNINKILARYTGAINVSYVLKTHFDKYDPFGNLLQYTDASGIPVSMIWSYKDQKAGTVSANNMLVAEVANAESDEIAHTSFENEKEDNWTYAYQETGIDGKTGINATNLLKDISYSGNLRQGIYRISFWAKTNQSTDQNMLFSGYTFTILPGSEWKFYQKKVALEGAFVLRGNLNIYIDEIRVHPVDAQMQTYTYDPMAGLTSVNSINNITSKMKYDDLQRLKTVKDHNENVIKFYDYKYK